ncbi:MAG: hypothetical protein M1821_002828 [Bathelium mastoideum]|nr:MAG: hypothetical protein M1821_002828 [Bathelium mastoideum]KAI9694530.1 MAG: hypothetical protein M1822_000146 [Bathelium mastoideum]
MAGLVKLTNISMRVFQFIWTLLVMSLVGNMIAEAFAGNPAVVNYDMFVAAFSMFTLFYLIPATFKESFMIHPIIMITIDVLNTIFFFCAGVAMASYLRVHSCGNPNYTLHNSITNGAANTKKRCQEAQASTAFLWFGFAAYLVSAVLSGIQGKDSGANLRGIRRPGQPNMAQV